MGTTPRPKYACGGCLVLQLALFAVCNALWVDRSFFQLSVQPDSRIQLELCLQMLGIGPLSGDASPYSALLPSLALPLIHWLGLSKWPFFVVQMAFAFLWVIATYLLGKEWFGARTGLAAASLLLWSMQPAVMVRNYLLDYPAAAVFTLQLYLLLKGHYFTKRWPSILFLLATPLLVAIKSHHLLCLLPVALGFAWVLLRREYHLLWGHQGLFSPATWLAQILIPLLFTLLGWLLNLWIGCGFNCTAADYFMLFCTGAIAHNAWLSLALHQAATSQEKSHCPKLSPFLLFLLGFSFALLASTYMLTRVLACGEAAVHARNNLGFPVPWQGDLGSSLQMAGYWCIGHLIELKTKHLQLFPFALYSAGLVIALARPRYLRGQAFLLFTTLFTSLLMSLCTYNSVRYEAPLLSLRCIFAVFWLTCVPGLNTLKKAGCLLLAGSLICGIAFNGAWLVSPHFPRTSVQHLFNEFCLTNGEGTLNNFDVFERAYDPQVRFKHTADLGKQNRVLWGTYSAYGRGLLFTCDPYPIDWGSCACGIRQAMHSPKEAAYLFVCADELKDMLFLRSDQIQTNLNYGYRVATASDNIPIIPASNTTRHSHFAAVASAPNHRPPNMFDPHAELIYTWSCPFTTIWLYKLPQEYVL